MRIEHWSFDPLHRLVLRDEHVLYTNGKGEFSIPLAPGLYDVFVSSAVLSPVAKKVEVKAGKETVFSPELQEDKLIQHIE